MRIGWGIIGCGDIADKRVAPAINAQADSDLVAFFSHTGPRAEEFARRHNARRAYDDLKDFLADPEINAVYVASPQPRLPRLPSHRLIYRTLSSGPRETDKT